MKRRRVMFDIDGVFANFALAFTKLGNQMFGYRTVSTEDQPSWDFGYIYTKQEVDRLWDRVANSLFWSTVPSLVNGPTVHRVNCMAEFADVYFVTSRVPDKSRSLKFTTEEWLRTIGIIDPTVVLSKKKGEFCRLANITHSLEDKWDNAMCIHWMSDSPQTASYLINRPYNQVVASGIGAEKVRRVDTVLQFISEVEHGL